ncbi:MAG: response regulator transcription factor [Rhodospirillales bacterium]|nr:response regulator transcription factor [Rhodospirillales bacterium]
MTMSEPTVYVIDDDESVRDALNWLITSVDLPVRTFESAHTFLESYQPDNLGCIVVDVRMPGMSGIELQKKLARLSDRIPIIIITGHGHVDMAVNAMKAGAFDFFEKPFDEQLLLDSVQNAMVKGAQVARDNARKVEIRQRLELLTPREREVLDLIVTGEPNKKIAHRLGVGEKTVESHRAKVMEKMQAKSLADLIKITLI